MLTMGEGRAGKPLRVLVVDDHPVVRNGLLLTVQAEPDLEVVGVSESAEAALRELHNSQPDVVLLDIHLPGANGLEATSWVKQQRPETRVVLLTVASEERYLAEAIRRGASGYVLKDAPRKLILAAIRSAVQDGSLVSTPVLRRMVDHTHVHPSTDDTARLTAREKEVLAGLTYGLSNKEIAKRLTVAPGTVKKYVQAILTKLACRDRAHAAATAIRLGLVE